MRKLYIYIYIPVAIQHEASNEKTSILETDDETKLKLEILTHQLLLTTNTKNQNQIIKHR